MFNLSKRWHKKNIFRNMGFWDRRTRIWTLICSTLLQNVLNSCTRVISNYQCNIFLGFNFNNLATSRFFVYKSLIPSRIRDRKVSIGFPWAFLEKHEKVLKNHIFLEKIRILFPSQIMHQNIDFWGRRTWIWTLKCSLLFQNAQINVSWQFQIICAYCFEDHAEDWGKTVF